MKHWAAHLIGKPYLPGACGPDAFDCIGLVRYYFKHREGVELPDYRLVDGTPRQLHALTRATGWRRTSGEPRDRDIMLMESLHGRHVGVVVQCSTGLGLLHSEGNSRSGGVVWQSLDTLVLYRNKELWRAHA